MRKSLNLYNILSIFAIYI